MPERRPYEEYLGDGLYADFDGYQIWLAANDRRSGTPTDRVALEPGVTQAFINYVEIKGGRSEYLMNKSESIIAKLDKTSEGIRQRYTVGTTASPISGALYLKPDVELPTEITISFLKEGSRCFR